MPCSDFGRASDYRRLDGAILYFLAGIGWTEQRLKDCKPDVVVLVSADSAPAGCAPPP